MIFKPHLRFVDINIAFWIIKSIFINLVNASTGIKGVWNISFEESVPVRHFLIKYRVVSFLAVVSQNITDPLYISVKPFLKERNNLFAEYSGKGDERIFIRRCQEKSLTQLIIGSQEIGKSKINGCH